MICIPRLKVLALRGFGYNFENKKNKVHYKIFQGLHAKTLFPTSIPGRMSLLKPKQNIRFNRS